MVFAEDSAIAGEGEDSLLVYLDHLRRGSGSYHVTAVSTATSSTLLPSDNRPTNTGCPPGAIRSGSACIC